MEVILTVDYMFSKLTLDTLAVVNHAIGLTTVLGLTLLTGVVAYLLLLIRVWDYTPRSFQHVMLHPWPFVWIGDRTVRAMEVMPNYIVPPPLRVMQMASSLVNVQALLVLAEFGIPDCLRSGRWMSADELATELHVQPDYLQRVLRAAAHAGLLKSRRVVPRTSDSSSSSASSSDGTPDAGEGETDKGAGERRPPPPNPARHEFALNALSAVLCSDHPDSVLPLVVHMSDALAVWQRLPEGLRTGKVPYELLSGGPSFWDQLKGDTRQAQRFNSAMVAVEPISVGVYHDYPHFTKFRRLIDVGGGYGGFVAGLAQHLGKKTPHCVIFDQPEVVRRAPEWWRQEMPDQLAKVTFRGGSFFKKQDVPKASDADAYTLRNILHDWDDEHCRMILSAVRHAMGAHPCTLLLVEFTLIEGGLLASLTSRHFLDFQMMCFFGSAKERTRDEFQALLHATGFRLTGVYPTRGGFFVIEAKPATSHRP